MARDGQSNGRGRKPRPRGERASARPGGRAVALPSEARQNPNPNIEAAEAGSRSQHPKQAINSMSTAPQRDRRSR